jgi:hypothetical protein
MELWGLQEIGMTEQRGKYWVQQKVFAFFKWKVNHFLK